MGAIGQKATEFLSNVIPNMQTATLAAIIFSMVLSLIYCFFGYKLLRIHISFIMLVIGATIGFFIAIALNLDMQFVIAAVAVLGILLAVLGFFFYKAGLFILIALLVGTSLYSYLHDIFTMQYIIIICAALGVFFAILACFFVRPVVIIMTSIFGALSFSDTLIDNFLTQVALLNTVRTTEYIILGLAAIIALFGIIFQFRSTENYEDRRRRR